MPRFYTINPPMTGSPKSAVTATNIPATNAFDFFEIVPAANKPIKLHWVKIGQTGTADFGDAQEEGVPVAIFRIPATVTSGSGGSTSPVISKVDPTGTAASFTAEYGNTTVATSNADLELLEVFVWNNRLGESQILIPEFRYEFVNTTYCVIRALVGPNDALSTGYWSCGIEEGG